MSKKNNTPKKQYFFVDFENTNHTGLEGITNLSSNDAVFIFVTNACAKIPLKVVGKITSSKAPIAIEKVENGTKNALDFQLSTFLGSLMLEKNKDKIAFTIVSKDKGYSPVVNYWNKKGFTVIQQANVSPIATTKTQNASEKTKTTTIQAVKNSDFILTVHKCCPRTEDYNFVISAMKKTNSKLQFHNRLRQHFSAQDTQLIYRALKQFV